MAPRFAASPTQRLTSGSPATRPTRLDSTFATRPSLPDRRAAGPAPGDPAEKPSVPRFNGAPLPARPGLPTALYPRPDFATLEPRHARPCCKPGRPGRPGLVRAKRQVLRGGTGLNTLIRLCAAEPRSTRAFEKRLFDSPHGSIRARPERTSEAGLSIEWPSAVNGERGAESGRRVGPASKQRDCLPSWRFPPPYIRFLYFRRRDLGRPLRRQVRFE